jgi:hypothetical protein
MILPESAVSQMTTPCAGSLELHTGPRCRLWKATGYSVNSAECGTMENVLQQVAGKCLLVENVTDPNRKLII